MKSTARIDIVEEVKINVGPHVVGVLVVPDADLVVEVRVVPAERLVSLSLLLILFVFFVAILLLVVAIIFVAIAVPVFVKISWALSVARCRLHLFPAVCTISIVGLFQAISRLWRLLCPGAASDVSFHNLCLLVRSSALLQFFRCSYASATARFGTCIPGLRLLCFLVIGHSSVTTASVISLVVGRSLFPIFICVGIFFSCILLVGASSMRLLIVAGAIAAHSASASSSLCLHISTSVFSIASLFLPWLLASFSSIRHPPLLSCLLPLPSSQQPLFYILRI